MFARVSKYLYPYVCLQCKQKGENGINLCERCHNGLVWNKFSCARCALPLSSGSSSVCGACTNKELFFDHAYAPFLFTEFIQDAIPQFKFNKRFDYGKLIAELFCQSTEKVKLDLPELLIPVPLYKKRIMSRGFNQSLELAKIIGKEYKIEVSGNAVKRIRNTRAQMQLTAKQRASNVKIAFVLNMRKGILKNK